MLGLMERRMFVMFCHARTQRSCSHSWQVEPSLSFWPSLHSRFCMLLWWSWMQNHIWTQGKLKARQFSHFSVQGPIVDLPKSLSRLVNRAGAFSGKGNGVDMARLRPEEVQHNQSSKYCAQKAFAARHESPIFLRFVQGFFARRWFCLPAYLAHCMHICWCNAACHHQGSSHIRKRCGTCLRRFGPQRDLFLCTRESNQVLYFESFNLVLCFAVMERHSAPRLLQFMWPFLWLLLLRCCTSRSRGWSNGYIVERHFRRLWMSTGSRSSASHFQGLMEPILATRACRFWLCAACGCTLRVSLLTSNAFVELVCSHN